VVAGTGPLHDEFVGNATHRELTPYVHVLGHRDDVERVLGALDLLLLPSAAEGVPGVVIEAQMTGCPVVTYPVGAVDTVVADGETGIVLPRPDTALMADAVLQLLADTERRVRLGAEGRRRADRFSTEHAAAEYARHLAALTRHRR
jgi:glycosyltransferase involved in cell wall biosynthesis